MGMRPGLFMIIRLKLWLQLDPEMSVSDVRNVLKYSCNRDSYTARDPARWGYGKLDVMAGFRHLLNLDDLSCDVNGDGEINIIDVNVIIDIIFGGSTRMKGDVNGDGEVNISDVNKVINVILGL